MQNLLGISRSTLLRGRNELGMNLEDEGFTDVRDERLVEVMQAVMALNPNIGLRRMMGALGERELHVQQRRVREMIRLLDPIGTSLRWFGCIYRRSYSVS